MGSILSILPKGSFLPKKKNPVSVVKRKRYYVNVRRQDMQSPNAVSNKYIIRGRRRSHATRREKSNVTLLLRVNQQKPVHRIIARTLTFRAPPLQQRRKKGRTDSTSASAEHSHDKHIQPPIDTEDIKTMRNDKERERHNADAERAMRGGPGGAPRGAAAARAQRAGGGLEEHREHDGVGEERVLRRRRGRVDAPKQVRGERERGGEQHRGAVHGERGGRLDAREDVRQRRQQRPGDRGQDGVRDEDAAVGRGVGRGRRG